jgi:spermidine synthase
MDCIFAFAFQERLHFNSDPSDMAVPILTASSAGRRLPGIRAVLALVGFTAVIGQIVLMRELIIVFNGNEISLGITLATWLLWTAAGSSLASRVAIGGDNARRTVAVLECLLAVSLPITVWVVRASKALFQTVPGELVGPVPMLFVSLCCLSVFCALSGSSFVVAARMYQQERSASARVASSSAYLFEAVGSALGGILASTVLLRFLDSFQMAALVALLNLGMAAILLHPIWRRRVMAVAVAAVCLGVALFIEVVPFLRRSSEGRLWRGFHLLESRDSIYGNLAVTETGNIRSLYDNGVILAIAPDQAAAEEAVHYALLEHPAPKRILLIGGGANGSIAEVLKHPTIERIDYVELDPTLIELAERFFPDQTVPLAADRRVHLHYTDGRLYLRTTRDRFDMIIQNVADPQTAQLNRFYTEEFFRSAREHLAEGGVLALQLRASEDYISPERAEFLRCIDRTLRAVFPYVVTVPGESMHFVAAEQPDVLTDDPQVLIARLQARTIHTLYVREYFLPFRMSADRMVQVQQLLHPARDTPVNRDFTPIAYYFDVILWSTQFKGEYYGWFRAAAHFRFGRVVGWALVCLLGMAAVLARVRNGAQRPRAAAVYCIAATGFTLMALQIFLLLGFQAVYGYVYHQLAILIGMFMAGIALGSGLGLARIRVEDHGRFMKVAALAQFLLALSAPALLFLVVLMSQVSGITSLRLVAQLAFPALAALCGMLGGYQFPIATELYLGGGKTRLGVLYAVDLLGGCAGALVLSAYLIPVFGFWKTAWLSAAVNLAPALLAARLSLEARSSAA